MPVIRVFDRITKEYQRLGYLKRLAKRVTSLSTTSLENLGNDLIDTVTQKINVTLTQELAIYIKFRLYDRIYKSLKDQTNAWLTNGGDAPIVPIELQDLYLADKSMPSSVGKLNRDDWDTYTPFGVNLGLIRGGTYSANTRAYSLLYLTNELENKAFFEYLPKSNPLIISSKQRLLFLYSLLENDGEVFIPLLSSLVKGNNRTFNDREAGDLLPDIYRNIIKRYRKNMLALNLRERLDILEKSATSIESQRQKDNYSGGSSREHASRPRLEPFVDIGLFSKPNSMRYEYSTAPLGSRWARNLDGIEDSLGIEDFLSRMYFRYAADSWQINASQLDDIEGIVNKLKLASRAISSSSGYAPIEELALLAGIESLIDEKKYFEINSARQALIAYQKENPYRVRFTVDRMGVLAHARFLEPPITNGK